MNRCSCSFSGCACSVGDWVSNTPCCQVTRHLECACANVYAVWHAATLLQVCSLSDTSSFSIIVFALSCFVVNQCLLTWPRDLALTRRSSLAYIWCPKVEVLLPGEMFHNPDSTHRCALFSSLHPVSDMCKNIGILLDAPFLQWLCTEQP